MRNDLKQAITNSYREGDFTLSSGGKSSEYWDVRTALLEPVNMLQATTWLSIDRQDDGQPISYCYAGIGTGGGLLLGALLGRVLAHRGLFVRDERKAHGRKTTLEGWPIPLKGVDEERPLILVDDVCTTGASLVRARQLIWDAAGYQVPVRAAVILGRDPAGWVAIREAKPALTMDVMFREQEVRP